MCTHIYTFTCIHELSYTHMLNMDCVYILISDIYYYLSIFFNFENALIVTVSLGLQLRCRVL